MPTTETPTENPAQQIPTKTQPAEENYEGNVTDAEIDAIQPGKANATDPDFLAILALAFFADIVLDPLMDLLGFITAVLPLLRRLLEIFIAIIIFGWMYWKSKRFTMPPELAQKMKGMEKKVAAKIEARIQKKVASRATRRALIRVGAAFTIEEIPGIDLFTSWIVAVLSML